MTIKNSDKKSFYPNVDASPKIPQIEEEILEFWEANKTFEASIEVNALKRENSSEYVFYDGPPFANGLPHYGHLLTGFVKDTVPRYQTMRGKKVTRRFGWDTHGLPAELEAEKELGISGQKAVTEFGIDKFNDACRSSVMKYAGEWKKYVTRQARWVDFEDDYKTLDVEYMESVIWAFKALFDKGLIYEGLRVLPYSWAAETVLSNMETKLDDSYRDRDDPALTVEFSIKELSPNAIKKLSSIFADVDLRIVAWTTTPWTLPSNLALAVGPDVEYSVVKQKTDTQEGKTYILATGALVKYAKELGEYEVIGLLNGADLAGSKYVPLFPYFADNPNAFQIFTTDFVTTTDGTGIVHLAPYGEDDFETLQAKGVEIPVAVDVQGKFDSRVSDYEGQNVFDANPKIAKDLKTAGRVLRHEQYRHAYPHCWRTDQPLIYRPMSSWFVDVTKIKARMIELNQEINWIPSHIKDGAFGMWLEGARDWSISRNRFWGSPIPVWKSDDPNFPRVDVYGSLEEIERDFGKRPSDLHRPEIDSYTRPNPDDPSGKSMMVRVEEVLDCWFESGSMPFAQVHYPFKNKEWFDEHSPADFIVEYIGQTRGWFYTLHVLATALFDRPAFRTCISHGIVLGQDGRKMSKRLKNYPDPIEVFNTFGSDSMRWFLQSSTILRGQNLIVDNNGFQNATRAAILPLWNSYYFFTLYANSESMKGEFITKSKNDLDNYILSKTRLFVENVTDAMDINDSYEACSQVEAHLDVLTNWFIRRSRERFWRHEKDEDKQLAYNTLYTVLELLTRTTAPLMPLVCEKIWQGLHSSELEKDASLSIHLTAWPLADAQKIDLEMKLIVSMDKVRDVCSNALSIRRAQSLRTRLPLNELVIAGPQADLVKGFEDVIKDEVNLKNVRVELDGSGFGSKKLNLIPAIFAPRHGDNTKAIFAAYKKGDWELNDGVMKVGGHLLADDEYVLVLEPNDPETSRALGDRSTIVSLDIAITKDLELEGIARDFIRAIQQNRKDSGFDITDRINIEYRGEEIVQNAIKQFNDIISKEVLSDVISITKFDDGIDAGLTDDLELVFKLSKV